MSLAFVLAFPIRASSSGETAAVKDNMTKLQLFHDASNLEGLPSTRVLTLEADGVVVAVGVPAADSKVAFLKFAALPACCGDRSNYSSRSSDVVNVTRFQSNKPTP